jgi:hypothetical protein
MDQAVGVIGLGVSSQPSAERIPSAGYPFAVRGIRPEPPVERRKTTVAARPPGATPPNLRKDLHAAPDRGHQLGVPPLLGIQASLFADSGIATGHDNPAP